MSHAAWDARARSHLAVPPEQFPQASALGGQSVGDVAIAALGLGRCGVDIAAFVRVDVRLRRFSGFSNIGRLTRPYR